MNRKKIALHGLRDGLPIGMGYFAVAFSIGIVAQKAGVGAIAGFLASFFTRASAGEYGVYTLVLADATYLEVVAISLIANLRYLLMNTAVSQRFSPATPLYKRLLVGVCCTDEIFGITIAQEGDIVPLYVYSASILAGLMWASGSACGIVAGEILPGRVVSALSVALYGMFLAIIIPVGKKDRAVLVAILVSFLASWGAAYLPYICRVSSGIRTILLTLLIASAAALIRPIDVDGDGDEDASGKEREQNA